MSVVISAVGGKSLGRVNVCLADIATVVPWMLRSIRNGSEAWAKIVEALFVVPDSFASVGPPRRNDITDISAVVVLTGPAAVVGE
jgi:hypothetical protein